MMNWKKEKPLIGTEGLIKGLQSICNILTLVTQYISFMEFMERRTVEKPNPANDN